MDLIISISINVDENRVSGGAYVLHWHTVSNIRFDQTNGQPVYEFRSCARFQMAVRLELN